jgi:FAD:protein FMN transferase
MTVRDAPRNDPIDWSRWVAFAFGAFTFGAFTFGAVGSSLVAYQRVEQTGFVSTASAEPSTSAVPNREDERVQLERPAMGTMVRIVAYTNNERSRAEVTSALEAAFGEMLRLDDLLSSWKESSDVGRLNRAEGQAVRVSAETLAVLDRALWSSRASDGAFDVTFAVISDLWRFGDAADQTPRIPSKEAVARRRPLIDFRKLEVNHEVQTVRLPAAMRMDFGGIAKGYVVDRAARVLKARGLVSFFVQAGGDLLGIGRKPSGDAWTGGVQDPRGPRGSFFASLEFSDHAFSTAGDYARAYLVDGRRYHHIIDPRTGYPATACRSVTVWAEDAFTADALDDAVFILGPEQGLALVERTPGVGAVIVDARNRVIVSQRLAARLTILRQPTDGP